MNTPLNIQTCKRIAHLFPDAEYWWVYCLMDNQWHITDTNPTGSKPTKKYTDEHYPCPRLEELIEKLPYIIMGRHLIIMKNLNVYEVGYWSPKPLIEDGLEPDVYRDYYKDLYSEDKDPKVACAKLLMKLEGIDEEA